MKFHARTEPLYKVILAAMLVQGVCFAYQTFLHPRMTYLLLSIGSLCIAVWMILYIVCSFYQICDVYFLIRLGPLKTYMIPYEYIYSARRCLGPFCQSGSPDRIQLRFCRQGGQIGQIILFPDDPTQLIAELLRKNPKIDTTDLTGTGSSDFRFPSIGGEKHKKAPNTISSCNKQK